MLSQSAGTQSCFQEDAKSCKHVSTHCVTDLSLADLRACGMQHRLLVAAWDVQAACTAYLVCQMWHIPESY